MSTGRREAISIPSGTLVAVGVAEVIMVGSMAETAVVFAPTTATSAMNRSVPPLPNETALLRSTTPVV
jgi:hypothetical protein